MKEKLRVGIVGCGQFCRNFVPIFRNHPAVEYVAVCDKFRDRAEEFMEKYNADEIFDTFDEMVVSDKINAVAIFTQRDLHGVMAIAALKAGKHVYSAVPMALKVDEILEIVRLVKETGLTYSMGETGVYRPASIYCRMKNEEGAFGDIVYAEAQYNHDMKRLYDVFKYTEGDQWEKMAGLPPLFYPTHSTSMVLSAIKSYAKKVVAYGYKDKMDPNIFGKGKNYWDNPFSNASMLMQLENGAIVRISENRRIAWTYPETYITSFNGTEGSYEYSIAQHIYVKMNEKGRVELEDVSDLINPIEVTKHKNDPDFMKRVINGEWTSGEAPIQFVDRLPEEISEVHTGHGGTHKFMIDDFCQAYASGWLSPTNAWQAARYNLPGLVAHESALQGGVVMEIPDIGELPSDKKILSLDRKENVVDYKNCW